MMLLLFGIAVAGLAIVLAWGGDIDAQAASRLDIVRTVRSRDTGTTVAS